MRKKRPAIALAMAFVAVLAPIVGVSVMVNHASAQPSEFEQVPPEQVFESVPSELDPILDWKLSKVFELINTSTHASNHSQSLNETLVLVDKTTGEVIDAEYLEPYLDPTTDKSLSDIEPGLGLQYTDTVAHEGRKVAIPARALELAVGHKPGLAFGEHENGTEWTSAVNYVNASGTEWAIFKIPAFSTNTITWSGQFTLEANPTLDGDQHTYDHQGSAANYTIEVTGVERTEDDTETATIDDEGTMAVSIAGNEPVTGPSANNKPEVGLIGKRDETSHDISNHDDGDSGSGGELPNRFEPGDTWGPFDITIPGSADNWIARACVNKGTTSSLDVEYYIEGSLAGSDTWTSSGKECTGVNYDVSSSEAADGTINVTIKNVDSSEQEDDMRDLFLQTLLPQDITVSDDAGHSVTYGDLSISETKKEFPANMSTTQLSLSSGTVNDSRVHIKFYYTEHSLTQDVNIEVNNGNWANQSGEIAVGSTQSLTTDSAWVVDGTNTLNITVGANGTLSADAPTGGVDLYYTHDGEDKNTVSYTAEKWTESYNVSKTYAQNQSAANLTIPFAATVTRIRSIEKEVNDGGWQAVDGANYTLSSNELTVEFGAVTKDDKIELRTDASKIDPHNASITVQDPTPAGDADLNTKIKLDTWNDDSYIAVGGTEVGREIHYIDSASWSNTNASAEFEISSQHLRLPKASAGDTFRVKTLPVEVDPKTGDVVVEVETVDSTEPRFNVSQGDSVQDGVSYTFVDAKSGQAYDLYSVTHDVVRDTGTASSPLTLNDDDSEEILEFREEGGGGGGTGIGGGGLGVIAPSPDSPFTVPLAALTFGAVALGLFIVDRRFLGQAGRGGVHIPILGWTVPMPGGGVAFWIGTLGAGVIILESLTGGQLSRQVGQGLRTVIEAVGPFAGLVAIGLAALFVWRRFIRDRGEGETVTVRVDRGGEGK